jgi:hypothetical protein
MVYLHNHRVTLTRNYFKLTKREIPRYSFRELECTRNDASVKLAFFHFSFFLRKNVRKYTEEMRGLE